MDTVTHISFWAIVKNTSYIAVFLGASHYLNLSPESAAVLGALIVTDVITGVVKAATVNGWRSIRSSVMERGLIAKSLIIIAPITVAVAGRGVGINLSSLAQSIISVLILSEAYSIIGNLYSIRTGQVTHEFDAIAYVLDQIKAMLKKIITEDQPGPKI